MSEYLYIMSNAAMPGLLKTGRTTNVGRRRDELSSATGVPVSFDVEHFAEVCDSEYAEADVHAILYKSRINPDREFFRVSLNEALEAFAVAIRVDVNRHATAIKFAEWLQVHAQVNELPTLISWLEAAKPKDIIAALRREAA